MRVVLAEDLALLRDGLARLLRDHGFEVVAAVDNGPALLQAVTELVPDVAVVDVRLPPSFTDEGLRAALKARRQVPALPVLVLSQCVEQLYARELLADGAGAVGYLLKDRVFTTDQFIDAVRRVAAGGTAMDPQVITRLLARNTHSERLARLTPREREVLALMAEGRSNEIFLGVANVVPELPLLCLLAPGNTSRSRAHQHKQRLAAGPAWNGIDLVYQPNGQQLHPAEVTNWYLKLAAEAGLPIRLHDLRHGAATLALAAGADHFATLNARGGRAGEAVPRPPQLPRPRRR